MTDRDVLLARLATLAADNASQGHLAERLCRATQVILGVDGAWITVEDTNPNRVTLCATDGIAKKLEDLQDVLGEGPCRDAFQWGEPRAAKLAEEAASEWPEFARAALQAVGSLSVHAFPMQPGEETFGVLSVYLADGRELPEPIESAQFLADAVGAALLRDPASGDGVGGDGPWSSRAEIYQATGMVVAQLRLPPEDALAILRAHAYAHDTALADIAHLVVSRHIDFRGDS